MDKMFKPLGAYISAQSGLLTSTTGRNGQIKYLKNHKKLSLDIFAKPLSHTWYLLTLCLALEPQFLCLSFRLWSPSFFNLKSNSSILYYLLCFTLSCSCLLDTPSNKVFETGATIVTSCNEIEKYIINLKKNWSHYHLCAI
jgi:hypothetical protein